MQVQDTVGPAETRRSTPRVTITTLAESLGLAKGTVSRALNGYPDISDATRARVMNAAKRMGYAPMAHAQAIRTGRVRALGIVLQVGEHDAQRPFLAEFLAGLTTAASAENWTLTLATASTDDEALDTMRRLIDERKADGFLLPRTRTRDARIEMLRALDVPFVCWGRTGDPTGCAWFDILGEDAMGEAVLRLHDLGHRRIAYLGGGRGLHYSGLRQIGFQDALADLGLPEGSHLIRPDVVTEAAGEAAARALLTSPLPPTALVCATDKGALGAYRAAEALGLEIGRDLSITAYDGIPEGAYASPPLTTFEVDNRDSGARLARLLIRRIRGEAPEDLRETAHARLCVRASDGPPRHDSRALARKIATARNQSSFSES